MAELRTFYLVFQADPYGNLQRAYFKTQTDAEDFVSSTLKPTVCSAHEWGIIGDHHTYFSFYGEHFIGVSTRESSGWILVDEFEPRSLIVRAEYRHGRDTRDILKDARLIQLVREEEWNGSL